MTYHLRFVLFFRNDLLTTKYFTKHYTSTHIRASPWFLGVALGYIIYKTKDQKVIIQKVHYFDLVFSKNSIIPCILASCGCMLDVNFCYIINSSIRYLSIPTIWLSWNAFTFEFVFSVFKNSVVDSNFMDNICVCSWIRRNN